MRVVDPGGTIVPFDRPDVIVAADMDSALYHASPAISNTKLSAMSRSMRDYFDLHERPGRPPLPPATAGQRAGTLMHCVSLEPHYLKRRYVVAPDGAPRRPSSIQRNAKKPSDETIAAIKWWDDFAREHGGKEQLTQDELATAYAQRDALLAVQEIAAILEDDESAISELSLFWRDAASGVQCRCRPDRLQLIGDGRVIALDLKQTAAGIDVENWTKTSWKWGYHRQAAHYIAGIEATLQREVAAFVFGAVTDQYPFIADCFILVDEALLRGRIERDALLASYAQCSASGIWPAFGDGPKLYGLPRWVR
jgi:hypothetical protein